MSVDPHLSAAIKEAMAIAPSNRVVLHTLEIRHPLFRGADGLPDSAWVVLNGKDLTLGVEAGAPIRGGEMVPFVGVRFELTFPPIENAPAPEMEFMLDAVTRDICENLDRAVTDRNKIRACYRVYLSSDLTTPQRIPPETFTLVNVEVYATHVTARARIPLNLRRAFPKRTYTATEFPGLIGR